jgi:hypothetical protein
MVSALRRSRASLAWCLALALGGCSSSSSGPSVSPNGNDNDGDAGAGGGGGVPPGGDGDAGGNPETSTGASPDSGSNTDSPSHPDSGGDNPDSGSSGADRFPASSIIYQDISSAALDPNSAAIIDNLAQAGWGSQNFQIDFSLTILHADSSVTPRAFTPASGYYTPDCDMTTVPIPPGGSAEGERRAARSRRCARSSGI